MLPPTYNFPLNLHQELPSDRRLPALNGLVTAVYEDAFSWSQIKIHEPLRSWLMARMPGQEGEKVTA